MEITFKTKSKSHNYIPIKNLIVILVHFIFWECNIMECHFSRILPSCIKQQAFANFNEWSQEVIISGFKLFKVCVISIPFCKNHDQSWTFVKNCYITVIMETHDKPCLKRSGGISQSLMSVHGILSKGNFYSLLVMRHWHTSIFLPGEGPKNWAVNISIYMYLVI